jgi:REP element-mobilizing transposase RayT
MPIAKRKSYNGISKIYFFTATIHKWFPLLAEDNNQQLIIDYLKKLSDEGYLTIYGFVIMPNHVHLIFSPCWYHTKPSYFFTLKYFRAAVVGLQGRLGSPAYQQLVENH